jgi:hypothetical protein
MIKTKVPRNPPADGQRVAKEGWLLKRSKKNPLKGWKRKYVVVTDKSFVYSSENGSQGKSIGTNNNALESIIRETHSGFLSIG